MTDLIDKLIIEIENATWRKDAEGPSEIVAWDAFRVQVLESRKLGFLADISPNDDNAPEIAWGTRKILEAAGQGLAPESIKSCEIFIGSVNHFCERYWFPYLGYVLDQNWESGWLEVTCDDRPPVSMELPPDVGVSYRVLEEAHFIRRAVLELED
jgi:hypothetical protein